MPPLPPLGAEMLALLTKRIFTNCHIATQKLERPSRMNRNQSVSFCSQRSPFKRIQRRVDIA